MAEAVNRPDLTLAVSPKYLSNEIKLYIFVTRILRGVYIIFFGFFKNFIFPTSGRYLQTSALKAFKHAQLLVRPKKPSLTYSLCSGEGYQNHFGQGSRVYTTNSYICINERSEERKFRYVSSELG